MPCRPQRHRRGRRNGEHLRWNHPAGQRGRHRRELELYPEHRAGDGSHTLTVTATDAAGNVSAPTTGFVIVVDASAPAAPVISSIVDDVGTVTGAITGGNPTNDTRPTLNGTAEANATVRIYDGTTLVGTVTADANGNWTLPQTSTTLTEGQHNFTATATDAAGNTSAASPVTSITVDVTPPALPVGLAVITNGTHVTGTAEAGSTVTITTSTGTVLGTATADGSGNFNVTIAPAQTGAKRCWRLPPIKRVTPVPTPRLRRRSPPCRTRR